MEMHEQVIEFNQKILKIPQREKGFLSDEEIEISYKCLLEEANEFLEACTNDDYAGIVDAIQDNIYFAFGILYKLGLTAEEIKSVFTAIHNANMRKVSGINPKRATGAADAIKPPGWYGPEEEIRNILKIQDWSARK